MKQFLGMPDVQVVALCDVEQGTDQGYYDGSSHGLKPALEEVKKAYEDRAKAGEFKGCDLYTDFREVLARKDIDTALICTPDHWHGLISIAAAQAGKDIYCEKPLTNSIAEGRAVCEAVKQYGRILQTGSHERSTGTVRQACELVRNGRIGKLTPSRSTCPTTTRTTTKSASFSHRCRNSRSPKLWIGRCGRGTRCGVRTMPGGAISSGVSSWTPAGAK
jgi:predicted dehydrogenase